MNPVAKPIKDAAIGTLELDETELYSCVACGLCLPHCPTYRVSGVETQSPRGRIALMQAVEQGNAPVTEEIIEAFDTCIQCRGCETACPGDVPFGHLMEATKEALENKIHRVPWWLKLGLHGITKPKLLRVVSSTLGVAQRLRLLPSQRLGLPHRLPIRHQPLQASGNDVWLFTGCVMDAWQRSSHRVTQRVIEATGTLVRPTGDKAPCCGALHTHAGVNARKLGHQVISALAGESLILVNSAGCGAALKAYGDLLGSDEARSFSKRVLDIHEWLADHIDKINRSKTAALAPQRVAIQDPCHLRHVQGTHQAVRQVLEPFVAEIVELDDEGMCCGAGGAFSILQRKLALEVRDRKVAAIKRANVDLVVSANPGCLMHLAAAGITICHPIDLIAKALPPQT